MIIKIPSVKKRQVIDITEKIAQQLPSKSGLINVFVKHTTAGITTADLDPGTDEDLLDFLDSLIPGRQWRHPHNPEHAPDHLLSSTIGPGVSVPVNDGQLLLGTWQRIILIEFDGPRNREVEVTFISSNM
jgi:secondary thiamine-phosphate synthase enzyme